MNRLQANRQILRILDTYFQAAPDMRFGQALSNLDIASHLRGFNHDGNVVYRDIFFKESLSLLHQLQTLNPVQMTNKSLNDLTELIDFTFSAIEALQQAKANDGKIDLKDFPLLFPLIMSASTAIDGVNNIPEAWAQASSEEREAVLSHLKDRFDLDNDVLEAKVEKLLSAAVLLSEVFLNLK